MSSENESRGWVCFLLFIHFYSSVVLLKFLILQFVMFADRVTNMLSLFSFSGWLSVSCSLFCIGFFLFSFFLLVIDLWVVMILTKSPQHWKAAKFVSPSLSLLYASTHHVHAHTCTHRISIHFSLIVLLLLSPAPFLLLSSLQFYVPAHHMVMQRWKTQANSVSDF